MLIGFTTYNGTVTAVGEWDGATERKVVRPALPESYEALFHRVGISRFLLTWGNRDARELLSERRLERAIGVIYLPETERLSHDSFASLPAQFDASRPATGSFASMERRRGSGCCAQSGSAFRDVKPGTERS